MTTQSDKLGICIIGCGYMGRTHAERWANVPETEIVAVVDLDEARADKMATQFKLDCFYTGYLDAIALPAVDVVSVCVPTHLHPEVTIAAAENGKHVLCEKPIALTLEDADRMIAAAGKNNIKLGLGFMRRHSPVLNQLKDLLASGEFGRPVFYNASDIREIRPKREMHDTRANGGPVIDMAVHLIDLWTYIFDSQPLSVSAQGLRLAEGRPEISHIDQVAIDTATIVVKFESGDIGTFVVSWGLPPKVTPPGNRDQIYGPNGFGELYYATNKQELLSMREGAVWRTLAISHEDMYQVQINNFTRWLLADEPFPAMGETGKSVLRVALAALESIQTGMTVFL
jgi:myo-inositol 2-dehydrogenase/D-chiro-inositol 1-dehydrogenase/scyllo-inositol 2-dehydrogenase (NAD+)